jgi:GNAT superfamily N-acetyltransferase
MLDIVTYSAERTKADIASLAQLLIDAVESGASVGFIPPLGEAEAVDYWCGVIEAMRGGSRILLAAVEDGQAQGAVQLALETRANGNHRGELMKLLVHRRARRRGLAKALMAEAESAARRLGLTLLVMDTRKGGDAEKLCDSLGYVRFGEVPGYARSADGSLHTTVFYYRQL